MTVTRCSMVRGVVMPAAIIPPSAITTALVAVLALLRVAAMIVPVAVIVPTTPRRGVCRERHCDHQQGRHGDGQYVLDSASHLSSLTLAVRGCCPVDSSALS